MAKRFYNSHGFAHRKIFLFAGLFLFALSVRLLPLRQVFDNGNVFFFDGDCYVHIRKILLHIASFPHFVSFDHYEGYPEGTLTLWPPVLDWLLSLISMTIGLGKPDARLVETLAALAPPVIGGLSAVALYFLAKRVFTPAAGILSALLLSIMPAHITATVVGRPDNEMMEPLMAILLFFSYVRMENREEGGGDTLRLGAAAVTSVISLVTLLFWRGGTLWIMVVGVAIAMNVALDYHRGIRTDRHLRGGIFFGLLAASVAVIAFFNLWGRQNTFSFNVISWFHVALFGLSSILLLCYGCLANAWLKKGHARWSLYPTAFLGLALAGGILLLAFPGLRTELVSGIGILGVGRRDPWIDSIAEYWPLFYPGPFDPAFPAREFGWLFWLVPVIVTGLCLELKRKGMDRGKAIFVFITVVIFALTLLRRRFENVLAIPMAICGGYLLESLYFYLKDKTSKRIIAVSLCIALSALLFYPMLQTVCSLPNASPGSPIKGAIHEAMLWLRYNTPSPGSPYSGMRPSYAVMSEWDYAGWLEYPGERPVVATMYGSEAYGLRESAAVFLATEESEANRIMDAIRARYLLITQDIGDAVTYGKILGISSEDFMILNRSPDSGEMTYAYGRRYPDLLTTRLLLVDGMDVEAGGVAFRGVDHYRLLYESDEPLAMKGFPKEVSSLKLFEYLRGAKIRVRSRPGAEIAVTSTVVTNRGRAYPFIRKKVANAEGLAEFILPYAQRKGPIFTGLTAPYSISSGGKTKSLSPQEDNVSGGTEFVIDLR